MRQLLDLIIITGPTASGKTAVAVELARRLHTEIISADSMQVYQYLTIGTAKPTPSELKGVTYHLVDHVPPDYQYNLGDFVREADELIREIQKRGRIPIVCGGTCLYLKGLLYGIFGDVSRDPGVRAKLQQRLDEEGLPALYSELMRVDPAATHIKPNDQQRILRALEVYYVTGHPITLLQTQHQGKPRYTSRLFILSLPRSELYARIEDRVDRMMSAGLLKEVQAYLDRGFTCENPAVRALGYTELIAHLEGRLTLAEAVAQMKKKTRHFAKRQLTWFRSMHPAEWVDVSHRTAIEIAKEIEQRLNIR